MRPGEVFATFHDPDAFLNRVIGPYRDGVTHTPEYKRTAVHLSWRSGPGRFPRRSRPHRAPPGPEMDFGLPHRRQRIGRDLAADARQADPASVPVLARLGDLHLAAQNWPLAEEIDTALRQIGTPEAIKAEQALQTELGLGKNRVAEGIAFLQSQIEQGTPDIRAVTMIVQARVQAGELAAARSYLDTEIARRPDDPQLQLVSAGLHALAHH